MGMKPRPPRRIAAPPTSAPAPTPAATSGTTRSDAAGLRLSRRGPDPNEYPLPDEEQLAKGPVAVAFDLNTATYECVEYFEYEDGSRSPLPPGTNYYTFALSDAQCERLNEVLARILVDKAIDEMALAGNLGEYAKQQAEERTRESR